MAKKKSDKVRPQLLKGFRDYPPAEQLARQEMVDKVRDVFELMGFLPLQTASIEAAETLLGPHYTEDSLRELFGFDGPDDIRMALRYEFTLSVARFVASMPELPLPFRRYQYGNVWRVDKPGPGRFREFAQFDIDIIGTTNLLADAEIMAAMVAVFEKLGIERFIVRYSNRKILNGLIEFAGIPAETSPDVFRVIDKLDKQGRGAVLAELGPGRTDKSGDKIKGLHLDDSRIAKLSEFLDIADNLKHSGSNPLDRAATLLDGIEIAHQGIDELREIGEHLACMEIKPAATEIDLTIVRGLGYYTGPVFETTLLDLPEYGSIFAGGRYDNLVERFLNRSVPGVGSSFGVDRLLAALFELKAIRTGSATSHALVTVMDRDRLPDYIKLLRELRQAGIPSEIFSGNSKNLTKQIKYADKVGIPFAIIAGSNEFEKGEVTVKNLEATGPDSSRIAIIDNLTIWTMDINIFSPGKRWVPTAI